MMHAGWRKCDFQVHSPRDPNWTGPKPLGVGDNVSAGGRAATAEDVGEERRCWAKAFVDACVARNLAAVALTDHHETIMVPYVQREIAARKVANPDFDLWFFPGMELTAVGGKQCLILFDADLAEDWWKQAQGKLSIEYAGMDEHAARAPSLTQLSCSYDEIKDHLDTLAGVRGRFIVLPNVSQGNRHTVLTDAAHGPFKRMSCVGGYLDCGQNFTTLSSTNQKRLSGEIPLWTNRRVYPLPTSDCRTHDFASLGTNNAWMKLAEPTAESIRQAFLGFESRIRIEPPKMPALFLAHVEISGSSVLGDVALALSPELNSIIGGRGSGKSSFLEYVAFGLGRSCFDLRREHYSNTVRMHALINDTIITQSAKITLTLMQDGAAFSISRGPGDAYQPKITYPNGSTQLLTAKELRALFPAVVYSQGELAEIGKQHGKLARLADLLQFVGIEHKREDDRLNAAIDEARNHVRARIQALTSRWGYQAELRKLIVQRDSMNQRVGALEKTLPAVSEADQATVKYYDDANAFEAKRVQASRHTDQMISHLDACTSELLIERDLSTALVAETDGVRSRYQSLYKSVETALSTLKREISANRAAFKTAEEQWQTAFSEARTQRDAVLEKLGTHRAATAQIIKLREEIDDINSRIGALDATVKAEGDPSEGFRNAVRALHDISGKRTERTLAWAKEIERLSAGRIRAVVEAAADVTEIQEAIEALASKTGSQEATRVRELDEALRTTSSGELVDQLRTECLALLHWRRVGAATGEAMPPAARLFRLVGDTEKVRTALLDRLDAARVEAVAVALGKSRIALFYSDGAREIAFEKASEGQRAAALLFMLLDQAGGPLLIDQPEGDLDNKIISDLTEQLHQAKQCRQLLFASHNANLVVNGASELVGFLDIYEAGIRKFHCAGAIDRPEVCSVITATMEGGEKAFKARLDKYGF